jgi:hypothetical protein
MPAREIGRVASSNRRRNRKSDCCIVSSEEKGDGGLIFDLEFLGANGEALERVKHRARTTELAMNHAASMVKNLTFRDQRAHRCQVKDQMGNLLAVVENSTPLAGK